MKKSIYTVDQIDALLSGKGLAILGLYGSADEITDPVEGGHYYIGTDIPYDVYTYVNGAWVNGGPFQGPVGPRGPAFTYDSFTPEQLAALHGKDGKSPYVNASTDNWMVWDEAKGSFVDSGVYAGGKTPSIGENGNWFVDGEDTGVPATNAQFVAEAKSYAEAAAASAANAGKPPYVGANGNWFVWDLNKGAFVDSGEASKGAAPVRGVDYWTEQDKLEIELEVLASFTNAAEVAL